jgi:peptidoglycan/xylan/chitin deacetylase (PgdA/CDA1 family)
VSRSKARFFREDLVAWALLAAAGSTIILGTNYWLHRRVLPAARDFSQPVPEPRILALAFDRIVSEPAPNKIDAKALAGHLRKLKEDGFVAVSLEALARFYEQGEPLPPKSLVLSFDHGYLSTFLAVDPLLRELLWPAVLFVMTERQEQRDPFFVYWDRVERMVASGLWEIGSHGHQGHDPISVDGGGSTGPFFIRPRWIAEEGRLESWPEFKDRIQADHDRAREILSGRTGKQVLAYAPPLRDVAGLSTAPESHRLTREIVESTYRLSFYDDRFGVNDRHSDPKRLKRLRVEPGWTPEELLRRIHLSMSGPSVRTRWSEAWVSGTGQAALHGDELVLRGEDRADVFRAGSQWVEDWELEGELYIEGGEIWMVQESDHGPEQWRFGGTGERTFLQTRSPGERTEVVASYRTPITPFRWHRFQLVKRGLGVWAALDSEPLGEHPAYLPGRWRGNVGIVHGNPGARGARLRGLRFREIPFEARVVASSLPLADIQAAIAEQAYLSGLSPRLFELDGAGLHRTAADRELLRILSHRFGWEIVPTVRISSVDAEAIGAAFEEILRGEESVSGLRVEWDQAAGALETTMDAALEARARELSWKAGRLVVVREPSARAKGAARRSEPASEERARTDGRRDSRSEKRWGWGPIARREEDKR